MDRPAGRFLSTGDGQVDFKAIFSKLAQYNMKVGPCWSGNAALNTRNKGPGRSKVHSDHIIRVMIGFDDFASTGMY